MRRLLLIPILAVVALAGCDHAALLRFSRLRMGEPERFRAVVLRPVGAAPAGFADEELARRFAIELALILNVAPGVRVAPAPLQPSEVRRLGVLLGTEVLIAPTWVLTDPGSPARLRVRVFNVYTGNPVAHVVLSGRTLDPASPDHMLKDLCGELAPVLRRARDIGLAYMPNSSIMVAAARATVLGPFVPDGTAPARELASDATPALAEGRLDSVNGGIVPAPREAAAPALQAAPPARMQLAADRRHRKHAHHKVVGAEAHATAPAAHRPAKKAPRRVVALRSPSPTAPTAAATGPTKPPPTATRKPIEPRTAGTATTSAPPPATSTPDAPTPAPPSVAPVPAVTPSVPSPTRTASATHQFDTSPTIEQSPGPSQEPEPEPSPAPRLPPSPSPPPEAVHDAARLHLLTAQRYLRMDLPEDAEAALRQALSLDPSFDEARQALEALLRDYPALPR